MLHMSHLPWTNLRPDLPHELAPDAPPPVVNLRDIGGYPVRGGGRVRQRLLYRSTDLSSIDTDGLQAVARLGLRTVYDLRTDHERQIRPDRLPDDTRVVVADVLAGVPPEASPAGLMALMQDPEAVTADLADGGATRYFETRYREFVELDSARLGYGLLFRDLAAAASRPALVHCTTGKDRTGWAVATLLLFLGVPDEVVMDEYLRSNSEMEATITTSLEAFRALGGDPELIRPLVSVRVSYLEAALAAMRDQYGSVEGYVADGLGVDVATRRAIRGAFVEEVGGDQGPRA